MTMRIAIVLPRGLRGVAERSGLRLWAWCVPPGGPGVLVASLRRTFGRPLVRN